MSTTLSALSYPNVITENTFKNVAIMGPTINKRGPINTILRSNVLNTSVKEARIAESACKIYSKVFSSKNKKGIASRTELTLIAVRSSTAK